MKGLRYRGDVFGRFGWEMRLTSREVNLLMATMFAMMCIEQ